MKNTSVVSLFAAAFAVAAFRGARAEGEVVSQPSAPVAVDLRADAVRGAVGTAGVRYSPRWTADGASVRIEAVEGAVTNVLYSGAAGEEGVYDLAPAAVGLEAIRLSGQGGLPVETNTVFSADADAAGSAPSGRLAAGWWRLCCRMVDASGGSLLEYSTQEFRTKGGMCLIVR